MQKAETRLANSDIYFEKLRGVAQGCKQHHGTTYSEEYSVLYKGSILTSETTESTDFFLRTDNGKERQLSFPFALPIRDGHSITALYARAGGDGGMQPIGLLNHTTERSYILPVVSVYKRLGIGYGASHVFAKMGCITGIVALLLLIYLAYLGRDSVFTVPLIALGFGSLFFVGYLSPKLDAGKNSTKYLAEYEQLKREISQLFAEANPNTASTPVTAPSGPATYLAQKCPKCQGSNEAGDSICRYCKSALVATYLNG